MAEAQLVIGDLELDSRGLLKIFDASQFKPADISADTYPLYYLMYAGNQKANYFASDERNGNECENRGWVGYVGMPETPTMKDHLTNNDCTVEVGGVCVPIPFVETDNDKDVDGDLYRIAQYNYTYSIRAIATWFCSFAKLRGWLATGESCPITTDPVVFERRSGTVFEEGTKCRADSVVVTTEQTVQVDYQWRDNDEGSYFVANRPSEFLHLVPGDVIKVEACIDEYKFGRDDMWHRMWVNDVIRGDYYTQRWDIGGVRTRVSLYSKAGYQNCPMEPEEEWSK